jgi:hypothetical protein
LCAVAIYLLFAAVFAAVFIAAVFSCAALVGAAFVSRVARLLAPRQASHYLLRMQPCDVVSIIT